MNATRPRLVEEYLKELDRSLAGLPSSRRREILADIEEHVDHQLSELGPVPGDGQIRDLLDRVGDPDDLAAEARDRFDVPAPQPKWTDYLALILLPLGGLIIPFLGWLAGVALLWSSRVWSNRDKLLGTLIVPGGFLLPAYLVLGSIQPADSDSPSALIWLGLVVGVVAPFIMVLHLARKLARAR